MAAASCYHMHRHSGVEQQGLVRAAQIVQPQLGEPEGERALEQIPSWCCSGSGACCEGEVFAPAAGGFGNISASSGISRVKGRRRLLPPGPRP